MLDLDYVRNYFAEELRDNIEFEEVALVEIAYRCRIRAELISNYLNGRCLPNPYNLSKLAEYFEVTVNELLGYDYADDDTLVGLDIQYTFYDEDEFAMHIRNRLDAEMRYRNIDIKELAERTGFNPHTIKGWLGKLQKRPSLIRTADLLKICDALDCTPSDILGY